MLMYYTRKVRLCMTKESAIELFEYIMTIPAYMAYHPRMRRIVRLKLREIHFPHDDVWDHLCQSIYGFLNDLRLHPLFRA
jgi:hypothetical protein